MQLDIKRGGGSIEDAIRKFFTGEQLSRAKGNAYKCDRCKTLADASKRTLIYDAPEYFTLHLKRFDFTMRGTSKITDFIRYPRDLDMSAYSTRHESLRYELMSVIVHQGRRTSSGHYYSFCKMSDGTWANFNDEIVDKVSEKTALKQEAYILVYARSLNKLPNGAAASKKSESAADSKHARKESNESSSSPKKSKKMPDNVVRDQKPLLRQFEDDFIGEVISRDAYERGEDLTTKKGESESDSDSDSDFHTPVGEEDEDDEGPDEKPKAHVRQNSSSNSHKSPSRNLLKQRAAIQQLEAKRLLEAKISSGIKHKKKKSRMTFSPFQPQGFERTTTKKSKLHTKMNGKKI